MPLTHNYFKHISMYIQSQFSPMADCSQRILSLMMKPAVRRKSRPPNSSTPQLVKREYNIDLYSTLKGRYVNFSKTIHWLEAYIQSLRKFYLAVFHKLTFVQVKNIHFENRHDKFFSSSLLLNFKETIQVVVFFLLFWLTISKCNFKFFLYLEYSCLLVFYA